MNSMKSITWIVIVLIHFSCNFLSAISAFAQAASQNVFALIIGVADYKDPEINDLQFSDDDALAFYHFLRSKAGGAIDSTHIKLLMNDKATIASIYAGKSWLEKTVKKNDLVYIYFAGHGDRENSIFELGFLLAHDTPHKNYLNNAVRIEDFNDLATTLTVKTGANVIIITDACHSGTLSGIDKVHQSSLVQAQLVKAKQSELRISSCKPDQLSQENEVWGGGRGVFSYYLINGLEGLADANSDKKVSMAELKMYVVQNVEQQITDFNLEDQTPVFDGIDSKPISQVDEATLTARSQANNNTNSTAQFTAASRSIDGRIAETKLQKFISFLRESDLQESFDFFALNTQNGDVFVQQILNNNYNDPWKKTIDELRTIPQKMDEFKVELAVWIHDSMQPLINDYLEGDEARLEERRYYNSRLYTYDEVVPMIEVGMKLLDPSQPLFRLLEIKKFYCSGIVKRLKTPTAAHPQELFREALNDQMKALAIEPNAAYIQNEIGILKLYLNQKEDAIQYFNKAIQLSEKWAIPYANLSFAYNKLGQYEKSLEYGKKAETLQPNLQLAKYNLGSTYLDMGNLLLAEEALQKSIYLNNRHFYPFDRLGDLYSKMNNFIKADSFYYEGALRKLNTNFDPSSTESLTFFALAAPEMELFECPLDTNSVDSRDYIAYFYWGLVHFYMNGDDMNAIRIWKKGIQADLKNPLLYHYIARAYYNIAQYEPAEFMFKKAMDFYKYQGELEDYLIEDPLKNKYTTFGDRSCMEGVFKAKWYKASDNRFLLAQLYENWHHYREAEDQYLHLMFQDSFTLNKEFSAIILREMYEKLDLWEDADQVLNDFKFYNSEFATRELIGMYKNAAIANPTEGKWWYKRGMLLEDIALSSITKLALDTILFHPKLNREIFTDIPIITDSSNFVMDVMRDIDLKNIQNELQRKFDDETSIINVSATYRSINYEPEVITPRKEAIQSYINALPLHFDAAELGDINYRIGRLFVASGSQRQAFPYFDKACSSDTAIVNYRMKAVDSGAKIYENARVYHHLQMLEQDTMINHPHNRLLARFDLMAGDYTHSMKVLNEVADYFPYPLPEKEIYPPLILTWTGKYPDAITMYQQMLENHQNDPEILYSIAFCYGKIKDFDKSREFLRMALKKGFNHVFVLHQEPLWKEVFGERDWKKNVKVKATPRKYAHSELLSHYYD